MMYFFNLKKKQDLWIVSNDYYQFYCLSFNVKYGFVIMTNDFSLIFLNNVTYI